MRVLVIGDTHGNRPWTTEYIYAIAVYLNVKKILQLGDFGYWEHSPAGVTFLDAVDARAEETGIPFYWLHGNHDKHSLALEKYGDSRDDEGFIVCRPNVLYIPQGHAWTWQERTFRAFGGAYSVDKKYRLDMELRNFEHLCRKEEYRASAANVQPATVPSMAGTLWFPEEEMSDGDMDELLAADSEHKDFVLSHDKPRSSNPRWNRKDLSECWPNQDRLQRALLAHTPRIWLHGHLHYHYIDLVRCGDDSHTAVVGLEPDDDAAEQGWRATHTYAVIDLPDNRVILGDDDEIAVDRDEYVAIRVGFNQI